MPESEKTEFRIIYAPTDEELMPTPEEREHLRRIRRWEEDSAKELADFEVGVHYDLQRPRQK